jgi:hypothetical protein
MKPDAIIEVRFKTADEGGRKTPLIGEFYSCPLFVDGEAFDCRIFLETRCVEPGERHRLPVKFLHRDLVIHKLSPGKPITLWEGKHIAIGKVVELTLVVLIILEQRY